MVGRGGLCSCDLKGQGANHGASRGWGQAARWRLGLCRESVRAVGAEGAGAGTMMLYGAAIALAAVQCSCCVRATARGQALGANAAVRVALR